MRRLGRGGGTVDTVRVAVVAAEKASESTWYGAPRPLP
jgi:hypothetical protein